MARRNRAPLKADELGTESIRSLLIKYALPGIIAMTASSLYNIVDSIFIGHGCGALALSGLTVAKPFMDICAAFGTLVGVGASTLVAIKLGEKDYNTAGRILGNVILLNTLLGALVMIIGLIWMDPILYAFGASEATIGYAREYMEIILAGNILTHIYFGLNSMLRSMGHPRTSMVATIVAVFINIVLDLLFVGPLNMGVFGAALATMLSQMIAGAGCLLFAVRTNPYFRLEREHFSFDRNITFRAMQIGFPLSLQWAMIAISTTGLQTVVNSFGSAAVAAFTATSRIENLVHMPFGSIGQALSTFAGQNYGARKPERIRTGFYQSMVLAAAMSVCLFLLMQLLGMQAVSAFVKDPEVIALGGRGLKLTSWFYLSLGTIYITRGIQNGMGDALFAFINGIIEVISRIGLPILLMQFFDIGVWVIWWTAGLTWMASAVFCLLRYVTYKRTL